MTANGTGLRVAAAAADGLRNGDLNAAFPGLDGGRNAAFPTLGFTTGAETATPTDGGRAVGAGIFALEDGDRGVRFCAGGADSSAPSAGQALFIIVASSNVVAPSCRAVRFHILPGVISELVNSSPGASVELIRTGYGHDFAVAFLA